jgi:carboxylesterase type B
MSKKIFSILFFVLTPAWLEAVNSQGGTTTKHFVMTDRGPVEGIATSSIRKFLGIPYAAPPVGELRWRPPQAHARWHDPLEATKFRSHCPQDSSV